MTEGVELNESHVAVIEEALQLARKELFYKQKKDSSEKQLRRNGRKTKR